jgi:hypothetical protein
MNSYEQFKKETLFFKSPVIQNRLDKEYKNGWWCGWLIGVIGGIIATLIIQYLLT